MVVTGVDAAVVVADAVVVFLVVLTEGDVFTVGDDFTGVVERGPPPCVFGAPAGRVGPTVFGPFGWGLDTCGVGREGFVAGGFANVVAAE